MMVLKDRLDVGRTDAALLAEELTEIYSEQGYISLADLQLVCKYHHGLYFCSYGCIDSVDLHYDSSIS